MTQVGVIGAGIAGMAVAARLQARGISTQVFEAHGKIGGCAGYFRRQGFSFDVGATTLVDFEPGGVGDELLTAIGMTPPPGEALPGYMAWLPDRTVTLHRDPARWSAERLARLGDSEGHRRFWALIDRLASAFWVASRKGIRLPIQSVHDVLHNLGALGLAQLPLARYLTWTMGDALRHFGLRECQPLCALLSMLIEDTVHGTLDRAPLINAALGITIRGAGLTRAAGGMRGFWEAFAAHYRGLGGDIRVNHRVTRISGRKGAFVIHTTRGDFQADQVVCTLPVELTQAIAPDAVGRALRRKAERDASARGGALITFLGVPEEEVSGQAFTHHQLLQSYDQPLGNGNNMFISVSAAGDTVSAPEGCRAVMISTHCALEDWEGLDDQQYAMQQRAAGERLTGFARRVYPRLGEQAVVCETGTPRTYARFAGRPRGAVGGVRQTLWNSNQFAIPHDIGVPGFILAGDSTFPGLGTVAGVLGSRIAADKILAGI
ncbi:MAG: NAD(P)/FAD-dependent oxidoreductase [Pleurocapsa minor GSE-CHR-MK-17-07R]|jgi:C-3',4' desaturase CrtD|nr:NAD(P)/FAD-dependent oxidoreductase [Pleurocapsa minor GSE-CHR-MK 17-07R]